MLVFNAQPTDTVLSKRLSWKHLSIQIGLFRRHSSLSCNAVAIFMTGFSGDLCHFYIVCLGAVVIFKKDCLENNCHCCLWLCLKHLSLFCRAVLGAFVILCSLFWIHLSLPCRAVGDVCHCYVGCAVGDICQRPVGRVGDICQRPVGRVGDICHCLIGLCW